jgi:restriction system protein
MPVTLEDGIDRWPTFVLTPAEYEEAVADLVRTSGHEVTDWRGPAS